MSEIICRFCGGLGECWRAVNTSNNPHAECKEVLKRCNICQGKGIEPAYLDFPNESKNLKEADKKAIKAMGQIFGVNYE